MPVKAHLSASILLVRDSNDGLEVLMVERSKTMRFAPGALVFPGGKLDDEDMDTAFHACCTNIGAADDLALRVAALRELSEETSILYTVENVDKTIDGSLPFHSEMKQLGLSLDCATLEPFAHWVTPETSPRRFDTRFFLAPYKEGEARHDGSEAVACHWIQPEKLLNDLLAGAITLMFPTRLNLMKLSKASTVAQALEAARSTPIVRVLPKFVETSGGRKLVIDKEAGFDVTEASFSELLLERGYRP